MTSQFKFQHLYSVLILFMIAACNGKKEPANEVVNPAQKHSVPVKNAEKEFSPLYRSFDYGLTWQSCGQGLPTGTQISFMEMLGNEMVLATDNEGVFISENNRSAWRSIGPELPNKKINGLHIADGKIYVTVFEAGIYYSSDKGQTWLSLNYDLSDLRLQTILKTTDRLLVGGDRGIYALKDGGINWKTIYEGPQVLSFNQQEKQIIAGTSQGVLRSADAGANWKWAHQKGAIHYTALRGDKIFAMYVFNELAVSNDWGLSWQEASYGPKERSYVYEVIKVGDYFIMSNNYGVHRSSDGLHWNLIYPNEQMIFFDFLVLENVVYGGMRGWDEFRGRDE
ncbi:MAG: hypothetical protein AAFZ15_15520 [Bacteroidota bacterium]